VRIVPPFSFIRIELAEMRDAKKTHGRNAAEITNSGERHPQRIKPVYGGKVCNDFRAVTL
jgi:hypothetical protein